MIGLERRRKIAEMVGRGAGIEALELAALFKVSLVTVRRDLRKLAQEGRLLRSHGGAVPLGERAASALLLDQITHKEEAFFIAAEAASRVMEGDTIMLDDSALAGLMARNLADLKINVLTNSLRVAAELSTRERATVILTGGVLVPSLMSLQGPLADEAFKAYHVDKFFFSCGGLDLKTGASEGDEARAAFKRKMLEISERRIILMERANLGERAMKVVCQANEIHELITDPSANRSMLDSFRRVGVEINLPG